jgi:nicotinamidase-related amidase
VSANSPRLSVRRTEYLTNVAGNKQFFDMRSTSTNTALLVIDVQQGLDDPRFGERNNPDAEKRIADLLAAWRAAGRPVVHVQHLSLEPQSPLREDRPGHALKPEVTPMSGEPLFQKHVNSAFIGTEFEAYLRAREINDLVVVGLTTDHCVSTTARMAANLGFTVTVVDDATATFERRGPDGAHYAADLIHRAELASLNGEFASVRSAQDIIAAESV